MKNLVTIYRYAQLCNTSIQALMYQVKKGKIGVVKKEIEHTFIDIEQFPPKEFIRRKKNNKL